MERLGENSWSESLAEVYGASSIDHRISKAIEEEDAFIEYILSLPAMSSDNVEIFKKKQVLAPVNSSQECGSGLEHLENLYKLMEHLGQLRKQNHKLQKRVKYLENIAHDELLEGECDDSSGVEARRKRSSKCKSGYGIRNSLIRSSRERSRSVGVDEIVKSRQLVGIKSKVSKWSKVKEAFRWEKVLLPEAASQDSGIGGGEYLRVPSDQSSFSVSPADSVLSGPQPLSSTSTSEDELELDALPNSSAGHDRCISTSDSSSQIRLETEDQDSRRSKSLDGNAIVGQTFMIDQHSSSKESKSNQYHKPYKTPWSKVKDIIQTRTGSIKKRRTENDFDEELVVEEYTGSEENKDYEEKLTDLNIHCRQIQEMEGSSFLNSGEMLIKKKLAPVLTITLPSTEELRTHETKFDAFSASSKSTKPPASPQSEEKYSKCLVKQRTLEEASQMDTFKKQVSSSSAGTSPPTPRRQSKWTKVKNAFLTSTSSADDILNQVSNSVPSSPVKFTSFIYDMESDDLSSGEFIDENIISNNDDVFPDSMEESFSTHCEISNESIHNEIKKNFEELQLRLSHEFHQKLTEWERLKNCGSSSGILSGTGKVGSSGMSSGTSSIGEEDKIFRKKMEEWDKMKSPKQREVTWQQLGEENLSPDFRKKLEQWEKLKSVPLSPSPESSSNAQPQFKKKITEWQRWRSGGSSSKVENLNQNSISDLPDDFPRKLQEWEKIKSGTSESDDPVIQLEDRSPSPSMLRKDYIEQKPKKLQQPSSDVGHKVIKSKSNSEVKELAWLEKELHKIEREKIRLERERDKYLEREARLEKMRRAIGSTQLKQEVLIPTSTGLFRFEGISQKFTRKLYEWEKARGIGPEASTFALLDSGYQPPLQPRQSSGEGLKKNGLLLLRSKSVGSVVDVANNGSCGGIAHQPSSLSLNNMENIESSELACEFDQETSQGDFGTSDNEEPEAVIVDVEDLIEETASPLIEQPAVVGEIPVYCYAPDEVTHLIDSSGSENEISGGDGVHSSYIILQENINLINKLQKKEDICRKIEFEMENLEEKMQNTALSKEKHLEILERVEPKVKENTELLVESAENEEKQFQELKAQLELLEQQQEELRHEEKTLKVNELEILPDLKF